MTDEVEEVNVMDEYLIDVPDPHNMTREWVNVAQFDTRDEAIAYVRETFGGDERGCICLVSVLGQDDDEAKPLGRHG